MVSGETRVIYLDNQLFPKDQVFGTSVLIDQNVPYGVPYCKLQIIPDITNKYIHSFPFSYEMIAQTIFNGISNEPVHHQKIMCEPDMFAIKYKMKYILNHRGVVYDQD